VCLAEGEPHVADARELAVCGIAVDLQHAAEVGEMFIVQPSQFASAWSLTAPSRAISA
jgi:hypothetical protein